MPSSHLIFKLLNMIPRLLTKYRKEVIPAMRKSFGYKNIMQVPQVEKVVLNIGVGKYVKEDKMLEKIEKDLTLLAGQKPVPTVAKKSIASFKIRDGMKIGYKTTLRKSKMYDFIDRLISIAFPRTRDFRGLNPKSFEKGVFSIGIPEHSIFPEINFESLKDIFGLEVSVVTNAKNKEEAKELLKLMGFPFRN